MECKTLKAAKDEIQKPSTCGATLFRCKFWSMFRVFHFAWSTWPARKTFVASWRNAGRWVVDLLVQEHICYATSCELDEKRATKPKFVSQSRSTLYFSQQLSSTRNKCFCCATSWSCKVKNGKHLPTNLQRNNVARQVEGFCISSFAASSLRNKMTICFGCCSRRWSWLSGQFTFKTRKEVRAGLS